MKLEILALYDDKLGEFMTPFFAQSTGAAVRSLDDLVNGRGEEAPTKHPGDFRLYRLGSFQSHGALFDVSAPSIVCECEDLKRKEG